VSIAVERCLLLEQVSEAELLKRSEEFKSALLSSVSHDLRTPLSAISASASSLIRFGNELAPETRADLLLMIQQQCDRLNRYTTNLLNLVRLRAGVDSTRFTECDALDVLGTAISRARAAGDGRAISKDYEVATAIVRADPVMLEQVFYNVLENAVRYSPAETPINVSAHKRGGWLLVLVEDHGAGIAETDRKRVFERFYRSHAGLAHEGNGLGLSIAKGFTEAFGGSIEASRSQGSVSGTTIKIELPLRSEEQA
jgi:two-component system sensor histidine kinase KdpD